ncbi:MAG: HD domain-containing protein [Acidimicrobiia bacterium]|nr:HD domain-containing protein [Acidimicrobiia bacterium]
MRSVGELGHLARRFCWTLRATPPTAEDEAWACARLRPGEAALWQAQHPLDRRHTVAVAHRVVATAGPGAPPWVLSAALLHDVGKAEAPMGVLGRTVATVLELVGARTAPGKLGRYLAYSERGAELLAEVGSDPEVVAWAREHHEPPERWTVPRAWGEALAAADRGAD